MNAEKELVKKAFAEAENEAKEQQIQEVKKIVMKTLEKLDAVKKEIKELQEKERILKMDVDDLKEGRLDLIAERQAKDTEAKNVSVVLIIKEVLEQVSYSPWYWPYTVVWPGYVPSYPLPTITCQNDGYCGSSTSAGSMGISALTVSGNAANTTTCTVGNFEMVTPTINGSVAKYATVGSYDVNGHIINLR